MENSQSGQEIKMALKPNTKKEVAEVKTSTGLVLTVEPRFKIIQRDVAVSGLTEDPNAELPEAVENYVTGYLDAGWKIELVAYMGMRTYRPSEREYQALQLLIILTR